MTVRTRILGRVGCAWSLPAASSAANHPAPNPDRPPQWPSAPLVCHRSPLPGGLPAPARVAPFAPLRRIAYRPRGQLPAHNRKRSATSPAVRAGVRGRRRSPPTGHSPTLHARAPGPSPHVSTPERLPCHAPPPPDALPKTGMSPVTCGPTTNHVAHPARTAHMASTKARQHPMPPAMSPRATPSAATTFRTACSRSPGTQERTVGVRLGDHVLDAGAAAHALGSPYASRSHGPP